MPWECLAVLQNMRRMVKIAKSGGHGGIKKKQKNMKEKEKKAQCVGGMSWFACFI